MEPSSDEGGVRKRSRSDFQNLDLSASMTFLERGYRHVTYRASAVSFFPSFQLCCCLVISGWIQPALGVRWKSVESPPAPWLPLSFNYPHTHKHGFVHELCRNWKPHVCCQLPRESRLCASNKKLFQHSSHVHRVSPPCPLHLPPHLLHVEVLARGSRGEGVSWKIRGPTSGTPLEVTGVRSP